MPYTSPPVVFHRKFTRPRVKVYRAADRGVRFVWNRYDAATIGCGVVLPTLRRRPGAWCVSLTWAKPVSEIVSSPDEVIHRLRDLAVEDDRRTSSASPTPPAGGDDRG